MAASNETRLVFPGLAGVYRLLSPYSYAFIRFSTGAVLAPHGVQKILNVPIAKFAPNIAAKGLPFPELLAYLTYFAESVAAVCLAIGLFTRIAAAIIGIEMLVIVFVFQWPFGFFWTARATNTRCSGSYFALPFSSRAARDIRSTTCSAGNSDQRLSCRRSSLSRALGCEAAYRG
jgi:putative oxidoreductase